jgi:hypothetical protein
MNRYYTKLDSISPSLYNNFENLGEQHVCGGGWTRYYRTDLSRNILLPDHLKQSFNLSYMTFIGDNAHPHVDLEIGCRINIYLSENNCPTKFFSVKSEEFTKPKPVSCADCTVEKFCAGECQCSYKLDNLALEDEFVARKHDIYLLNIRKIHSVEGLSKTNYREALSFTTDLSYETVYESLRQYGSFSV